MFLVLIACCYFRFFSGYASSSSHSNAEDSHVCHSETVASGGNQSESLPGGSCTGMPVSAVDSGGKAKDLAELLRQHSEKPVSLQNTQSTPAASKKKKRKRGAKKAEVDECRVPPCGTKSPAVGAEEDSLSSNVSISGQEKMIVSSSLVSLASTAMSSMSLSSTNASLAAQDEMSKSDLLKQEEQSSCSALDVPVSSCKVDVDRATVTETMDQDIPAPGTSSNKQAKATETDIELRLDSHGTVHEGVCACGHAWYIHATLLMCNQAGLVLHGLASDSLESKHTGRALRYLNIAGACFCE